MAPRLAVRFTSSSSDPPNVVVMLPNNTFQQTRTSGSLRCSGFVLLKSVRSLGGQLLHPYFVTTM